MKYLIIVCMLLAGCAQQSVLIGIGGAYIPRVPEAQMTGDVQFHLSVEHVVPITKTIELRSGYHHYSNGSDFGIGGFPNYGFDAIGSQFVFKIH